MCTGRYFKCVVWIYPLHHVLLLCCFTVNLYKIAGLGLQLFWTLLELPFRKKQWGFICGGSCSREAWLPEAASLFLVPRMCPPNAVPLVCFLPNNETWKNRLENSQPWWRSCQLPNLGQLSSTPKVVWNRIEMLSMLFCSTWNSFRTVMALSVFITVRCAVVTRLGTSWGQDHWQNFHSASCPLKHTCFSVEYAHSHLHFTIWNSHLGNTAEERKKNRYRNRGQWIGIPSTHTK